MGIQKWKSRFSAGFPKHKPFLKATSHFSALCSTSGCKSSSWNPFLKQAPVYRIYCSSLQKSVLCEFQNHHQKSIATTYWCGLKCLKFYLSLFFGNSILLLYFKTAMSNFLQSIQNSLYIHRRPYTCKRSRKMHTILATGMLFSNFKVWFGKILPHVSLKKFDFFLLFHDKKFVGNFKSAYIDVLYVSDVPSKIYWSGANRDTMMLPFLMFCTHQINILFFL